MERKIKKEKRKLQKRATLVISYSHATPSNAFYDKVTASKKKRKRHERENLCAKTHTLRRAAWHSVDPADATKEESSRAGEK